MKTLIGENVTVTTAAGNTHYGRLIDYASLRIYILPPWWRRPFFSSGYWIALEDIQGIKTT